MFLEITFLSLCSLQPQPLEFPTDPYPRPLTFYRFISNTFTEISLFLLTEQRQDLRFRQSTLLIFQSTAPTQAHLTGCSFPPPSFPPSLPSVFHPCRPYWPSRLLRSVFFDFLFSFPSVVPNPQRTNATYTETPTNVHLFHDVCFHAG